MKYLWRLYYLFITPKNKSEIAIAYCRKNGKPYIALKLAKRSEEDYL